jgi:hypothetical protein
MGYPTRTNSSNVSPQAILTTTNRFRRRRSSGRRSRSSGCSGSRTSGTGGRSGARRTGPSGGTSARLRSRRACSRSCTTSRPRRVPRPTGRLSHPQRRWRRRRIRAGGRGGVSPPQWSTARPRCQWVTRPSASLEGSSSTATAAASSAGRPKITCGAELVVDALEQALQQRRPGRGLVHHSAAVRCSPAAA